MKPQGSLPCSLKPDAVPCPEPTYSSKIQFNIVSPSPPNSSMRSLPFRFSHQILYAFLISPMSSRFPAHFIPMDLITLIIFGEAHKIRSSSLCILLHSTAPSSLLGSQNLDFVFFPVCESKVSHHTECCIL